MARWLCKQEPDCYSIEQLQKDGQTVWDGVANPQARKNLWAMKPGDRVLYYHTGKEKAIVGEMEVVDSPSAPPEDEKAVRVTMKFICQWPTPISLASIKAVKSLETWDLVRLPRLSVMAVSDDQWKAVMALAE